MSTVVPMLLHTHQTARMMAEKLKTSGIRLVAPPTAPQKVSSGETQVRVAMNSGLWPYLNSGWCPLGSAQQRNSHTGHLREEHESQEFAHIICWAVAEIRGLPQTVIVEGRIRQAESRQHMALSVRYTLSQVLKHQDVASVSPSLEYGLASPASQR